MDDKLIDIKEVLYLFKKKFWIILLVTVITTGVGFYKSTKMITRYQGVNKIFVGKGDSLLNYYPEMELKYYNDLMTTFNEVIKVGDSLNDSLEKNNSDKIAAEVVGGINITGSEKSPIFTITYNSSTQEGMKEVINAVVSEFSSYIKKMIPEANPRSIDEIIVYPIIPNKKKLVIIAFAIGLILSIGIIFLIDYLDDTIKSKERLEKLLPIPVLGEIPKHEKGFKEE